MKRALAFVGLVALTCAGCSASSDAMGELGFRPPSPPRPGYATVVFVRPSAYAPADRFSVFSDRYGFLGHSLAESWFAAELPPGQHVFCANDASALRATLLPGRSYYVEVSARYAFIRTNVELIAIAPRFPNWASREEWLAETDGYVLVDRRAEDDADIPGIVGNCQKQLSEYDAEALDERTLNPGDGI